MNFIPDLSLAFYACLKQKSDSGSSHGGITSITFTLLLQTTIKMNKIYAATVFGHPRTVTPVKGNTSGEFSVAAKQMTINQGT